MNVRIPSLLASTVLLLGGCSRIPGCGDSASGVKRTSEKVSVSCDIRKGRRPRDGCVTKTIECGDTVEGNTLGGKSNFDGEFYRSKYCVPFDNGYGGKERVYRLEVPAHTIADIWLDSSCEDLDLFALRWNYDGKCPTVKHLISECEGDESSGGGHVRVVATTRSAEYLVAVDGKNQATGAFGLTVDCMRR